MNKQVECIHCHVPMELGFFPDRVHQGYAQQKWSSGKPKPSFWTGLKLEKDKVVPVKTWRCPKCGYLESYASPEEPDQ